MPSNAGSSRILLNSSHATAFSISFALMLSLCAHAIVRADVEIKSEIKVTGSLDALSPGGEVAGRRGPGTTDPASGAPSSGRAPDSATASSSTAPETTYNVTSYFKGSLARREITGQSIITLYDASSKKVTLINPKLKTYCVLSEKDAAKLQVGPLTIAGPAGYLVAPAGTSIDTTVSVDPTGLVQTNLGRDTHKFTAYGSLSLVRDQAPTEGGGGGFGGGGVGRGRRGGEGGGSRSPGGSPRGGSRNPTTEFDGEYWLAAASNLPEGAKASILPLYQLTVPDGPIMAALYGRVARLKMMPMASKMLFGNSFSNLTSHPSVVIEMQVKSIQNSPIEDGQFKVPDGYEQVRPEAMQRQAELAGASGQP